MLHWLKDPSLEKLPKSSEWLAAAEYLQSQGALNWSEISRLSNRSPFSSATTISAIVDAGRDRALDLVDILDAALPSSAEKYTQKALEMIAHHGRPIRSDFVERDYTISLIQEAHSPFFASSVILCAFNEKTLAKIMSMWDSLMEIARGHERQEVYSLAARLSTGFVFRRLFDLDDETRILDGWNTLMACDAQLSFDEAIFVVENIEECSELPAEWIKSMVSPEEKPVSAKMSSGVNLVPGAVGVSLSQKTVGVKLITKLTPHMVSTVTLKLNNQLGCYVMRENDLSISSHDAATFVPVSGDYKAPKND